MLNRPGPEPEDRKGDDPRDDTNSDFKRRPLLCRRRLRVPPLGEFRRVVGCVVLRGGWHGLISEAAENVDAMPMPLARSNATVGLLFDRDTADVRAGENRESEQAENQESFHGLLSKWRAATQDRPPQGRAFSRLKINYSGTIRDASVRQGQLVRPTPSRWQ
jgi:hypothetical protein